MSKEILPKEILPEDILRQFLQDMAIVRANLTVLLMLQSEILAALDGSDRQTTINRWQEAKNEVLKSLLEDLKERFP